MGGTRALLAATVTVVGWGIVCVDASGAPPAGGPAQGPGIRVPVAQTALSLAGRLEGTVTDDRGMPVAGAAVTAQGTELLFAVTDGSGHFVIDGARPGPYLLRAQRPGYAASRRAMVEVLPAGATRQSLKLARLESDGDAEIRRVLAAGLSGAAASAGDVNLDPAGDASGPSHDHGATAWRLRHLKRSVLRDVTIQDVATAGEAEEIAGFTGPGPALPPIDFGGGVAGLPVSGQVQLLTASSFDSPEQLFTTLPPMGVTFVSISAPAGSRSSWTAQGAVARGEVSSWVLGGTYTAVPWDGHSVDAGATYSSQRYEGTRPASLLAVREGNRYVGAIYGFDHWQVREGTTVSYGMRYARYGYLDEPGLVSPSAAVRWAAGQGTWLRALVSRRAVAPGAEEFVPSPVAGMWLPPQRTFMPVPGTRFTPEVAEHLELALDRQVGVYIVSARGFTQAVDDQMITVFGVRAGEAPRTDLGHYYTASAGDVRAYGWSVAVSRPASSRVRGTVEYTVAETAWTAPSGAGLVMAWVPSVARASRERLHDVTASVETDIPETATRVFAAYKINNGYAAAGDLGESGLDARFDVQVSQRLPFMGFTSADWEVLVAVRNLFRDQADGASVYDELLVVRPPKRIVGGLLVKF